MCLVTLAALSCTRKETNTEELLLGRWFLTERTIDTIRDTLSECELQSGMEFSANGICILHDACAVKSINSGWSYRNGMLNIAEDLPAAYYIEQLNASILSIRRNDISAAGTLQVTVSSYSRGKD